MTKRQRDDLVRLAEYSSDLEAQIDAVILRSADILVQVRNNASYMPMPGFGVNLYVLGSDLTEAQTLLAVGRQLEPAMTAQTPIRRSQNYLNVRLAMRIGLAIYLLLTLYSFIVFN